MFKNVTAQNTGGAFITQRPVASHSVLTCALSGTIYSKQTENLARRKWQNMYDGNRGVGGVVMVRRMKRELTLPWLVSLEARALL